MPGFEMPDKDAEILEVLSWLKDRLGPRFRLMDHWGADRSAIGIAAISDPTQLVYIASLGQPARYSVELESAPTPGSDLPYSTVGQFNGVDREELARLVAQHLALGKP